MQTIEDCNTILSTLPGFPFGFMDTYQGVHPRQRGNNMRSEYFPFSKVFDSNVVNCNDVAILWEESSDTTIVKYVNYSIWQQLIEHKLIGIVGVKNQKHYHRWDLCRSRY
jgi:hypothetical protein